MFPHCCTPDVCFLALCILSNFLRSFENTFCELEVPLLGTIKLFQEKKGFNFFSRLSTFRVSEKMVFESYGTL